MKASGYLREQINGPIDCGHDSNLFERLNSETSFHSLYSVYMF